MEKKNKIEIYKVVEGEVVFDVDAKHETIWATQEQIAKLFSVTTANINMHLKNIYKEKELSEERTIKESLIVQQEGKRTVRRRVKNYNLDAIISVGYRVNSRKATDFRIWATKVLKSYVVDGVAVNERRLKEMDYEKLQEIEGVLSVVKRLIATNELTELEVKGVVDIISKYSASFEALKEYDEGYIPLKIGKTKAKILEEGECLRMIEELKNEVGGDSGFGRLRGEVFSEILGEIYEKSEGKDVYKTVAEKAANLLYLIIKKRPFEDGNKRIGALLFVVFLTMNDYHLAGNGETKISDRALTALVLLIAESSLSEKEIIVALVCKLIEK